MDTCGGIRWNTVDLARENSTVETEPWGRRNPGTWHLRAVAIDLGHLCWALIWERNNLYMLLPLTPAAKLVRSNRVQKRKWAKSPKRDRRKTEGREGMEGIRSNIQIIKVPEKTEQNRGEETINKVIQENFFKKWTHVYKGKGPIQCPTPWWK